MSPTEYHDSDIHNSRIAEIRGMYDHFASDAASDPAEQTRRFTDAGYFTVTALAIVILIGCGVVLAGAKLGWWVA